MSREYWIDAQLSPSVAIWLRATFQVPAVALRDLVLRDATDQDIFMAARQAPAVVVVMTKDRDFGELVLRYGAPPQVLWLTCGNTSYIHLRRLLQQLFPQARALLEAGGPVVEIADPT